MGCVHWKQHKSGVTVPRKYAVRAPNSDRITHNRRIYCAIIFHTTDETWLRHNSQGTEHYSRRNSARVQLYENKILVMAARKSLLP